MFLGNINIRHVIEERTAHGHNYCIGDEGLFSHTNDDQPLCNIFVDNPPVLDGVSRIYSRYNVKEVKDYMHWNHQQKYAKKRRRQKLMFSIFTF